MKFCANCGKQLDDNAVICPNCGCQTGNVNMRSSTGYPVADEHYTTLSIVGFVLCFCVTLAGLICSILAYKSAKEEGNRKSQTLSKAGIIISSVSMGIGAITGIIFTVVYIGIIMAAIGSYPGIY